MNGTMGSKAARDLLAIGANWFEVVNAHKPGHSYRFVFSEERLMLYVKHNGGDDPVRWQRCMACTVYEIKPAPNITSGNEALGRTLAYQSPSDRWCAARGRKVALRKALPGVYPGGKEHKGPRRQVWEAYNEWETMSQRAKAVSEQEGKLRPEPVF